ncbi:DNA primase [bacterium]|nr:DNA primase [bacterium]
MIEKSIISNLILDDEYFRKTIPFIKDEYFHDHTHKTLFKLIDQYVKKYSTQPSIEALIVDLEEINGISGDEVKNIKEFIADLDTSPIKDKQWLLDHTEQFCQDKAVYNAIMSSIQILDGKGNNGKGSIPQLLSDALAVSFDSHVGHDFLEDYQERYDFYHRKEEKVAFDLDYFNKITKGGLARKTLNIALAGTGVGKSLFMCHCAASNLTKGLNVLYITLEMAEEKIAERIDANLLNVTVDELSMLPYDAYQKKIERVKGKTTGKLVIKEYPTSSAGSANFRHLLNELKIKKQFVPQIIYIDYLNICVSSRFKHGSNINSYTYVKAIAEELRGLAGEFNVPIVSATQTTRSGYTNTDLGLEDTSESFGLPATADIMFALISSEELQDLNQMMVKQLKNRYSDPSTNRKFVIGVDRSRMRLYDVEQHAQNDIIDDTPSFDSTPTGKFSKGTFKDFH